MLKFEQNCILFMYDCMRDWFTSSSQMLNSTPLQKVGAVFITGFLSSHLNSIYGHISSRVTLFHSLLSLSYIKKFVETTWRLFLTTEKQLISLGCKYSNTTIKMLIKIYLKKKSLDVNLVYIWEQGYQRILKTKHLLANLNRLCLQWAHRKRSSQDGWRMHRKKLFSL